MNDLSTRARITLLVVIAALPAFALIFYGAFLQRETAEADAREALARTASLAARQQGQVIEGVRLLLVASAHAVEELRANQKSCDRYLAGVLGHSTGLYHAMGFYDARGRLTCNAIPWKGTVFGGDRKYFREAMNSGEFSIGEFQVGRVTKRTGINFGHPLRDAQGELLGVVFVALDLAEFNRMAAGIRLPESSVLTVLDHQGTVLARQPEDAARVGEKLRNQPVLDRVLSGASGVFEGANAEGVRQVFAYDTVSANRDGFSAIRVLLHQPLSAVYADADRAMVRNLAGLLVGTLLLIVVGWYGAELFILRSVRRLLAAARRVRGGDLGARTRLRHTRDELGQLGVEFDRMAQVLQERNAELTVALKNLNEQAITDALTGLLNRRYLDEYLPREIARAARKGESVAVVMLDLDHFKRFNDSFGHEAGDRVLQDVAGLLRALVRSGDVACRFGGEEFVLIMSGTGRDGALRRAEDIRAAVSRLELVHRDRPLGHVTVSLGLALFPEHGDSADVLLRAADGALYAAKNAGRDRVAVAEGDAVASPA